MKGRLILLALDAADVGLIRRWAGSAELKSFSRILAASKNIRIENEPGLYVGCVWPTISTGTSPAWHGRYCWRQLRPGTYEDEFFQVDQIGGEPIWDMLGNLGKSVCVIDIPKSMPGNRFRGRFVKDWGTHDPSTGGFKIYGWMKPDEFLRRYGRDEVGHCDGIDRTAEGFQLFVRRLLARASARTRMVCDVLSECQHEVLMVAFSEAHCVGHQCWHLHDPNHVQHDSMLRHQLGDPVLDIYRALDRAVGRILDQLRECDTVMLMATHGMGSHYNAVELLPSIVADLEFEALSESDQEALQKSGVPHLLSHDSRDFRRRLRVFPVPNNGAYAAFRLNILGREPEGKIAPESAEQFLRDFNDRLMSIRNADTGGKIFVSSVFPRESYSGPLLDSLPDLLVEWNRSSLIKLVATPRSLLQNSDGANPRTGDHRDHGEMWVLGPGAELFEPVESIRTSDVSAWIVRVCEDAGGILPNDAARSRASNPIGRPTMDGVQSRLDAVRRAYGAWTAHNIELPGGHFTLGREFLASDSARGDYFVEVVSCSLGRTPADLRVLDLGCLEGAIAVQFAKAGACVDGVDIRPASIAKAAVVRDILGLKNLRFLVGDALNLSAVESLEASYDVIICAGLLYHLDAPDQMPFLRALASRCSALAIFDTHFAVDAPDEYQDDGEHVFRGRFIQELMPGDVSDGRDAMWAGMGNERSFWLSESSLVNAIYLAGFGLVARVGQPFFAWPWQDRGTWIAYPRSGSGKHFRGRMVDELDPRPSVHPTVSRGYNYALPPAPTNA